MVSLCRRVSGSKRAVASIIFQGAYESKKMAGNLSWTVCGIVSGWLLNVANKRSIDSREQLRVMRASVEASRSRCDGSGSMCNDLANATESRGILVSSQVGW